MDSEDSIIKSSRKSKNGSRRSPTRKSHRSSKTARNSSPKSNNNEPRRTKRSKEEHAAKEKARSERTNDAAGATAIDQTGIVEPIEGRRKNLASKKRHSQNEKDRASKDSTAKAQNLINQSIASATGPSPGAHADSRGDDADKKVGKGRFSRQLGTQSIIAVDEREEVAEEEKEEDHGMVTASAVESADADPATNSKLGKESTNAEKVAAYRKANNFLNGATSPRGSRKIKFRAQNDRSNGRDWERMQQQKSVRVCQGLLCIVVIVGVAVGSWLGLGNNTLVATEPSQVIGNATNDLSDLPVSSESPTESTFTTTNSTSTAPSGVPSSLDVQFFPPSVEDCDAIAKGDAIQGQDILPVQSYQLNLDATPLIPMVLSFSADIIENKLSELLVPVLTGCDRVVRKLRGGQFVHHRHLIGDAIFSYAIGNVVVGAIGVEGAQCMDDSYTGCHRVSVKLDIVVKDAAVKIFDVFGELSAVLGGGSLIEKLEVTTLYQSMIIVNLGPLDSTASPSANDAEPTPVPAIPTSEPTQLPTFAPMVDESRAPSTEPTPGPSPPPTSQPTALPTVSPTEVTSVAPTITPTLRPTQNPTLRPTQNPTQELSLNPSFVPSLSPSMELTLGPTPMPSLVPTFEPTETPSLAPISLSTNRCAYLESKLGDRASLHQLAIQWMCETDTWEPSEDKSYPEQWLDRYAVAALLYAANNDNPETFNHSDLAAASTQPTCSWSSTEYTFLGCSQSSKDSKITSINGGHTDKGLPTEIGLLTDLQSLSFPRVVSSEDTPLIETSLPSEVGALTKLHTLSGDYTVLGGTLPSEIGNLTQMRRISLAYSRLWGTVPTEIGNLSLLTQLDLLRSKLEGPIPSEIGNLSKLTGVHLGHNHIEGDIPTEIGNLSNMSYMSLSDNKIDGTIPSEIGKMSQMASFQLYGNAIQGTLPTEIGALSQMVTLLLHSHAGTNSLEGTIPTEIGRMTKMVTFNVGGNKLVGSIPTEIGNLSQMETFNLGSLLEGTIPTEIGNMGQLRYLGIGGNIEGTIPTEIGNLGQIITLGLAGNNIRGTIPSEIGNLSKLLDLNMNTNSLEGTVPTEIGRIREMGRLLLAQNKLTGTVPNIPQITGYCWLYQNCFDDTTNGVSAGCNVSGQKQEKCV
ncbi:unnamed protein product [Cylindrotheca closterium]|uniref:Disease resistance R13L4/SHOC-2-like LRR domain-containing protein n=1 Tax=Cylindrotheca closterium TaxID=2856 RepID=A0AAD2FND3_9STRA|nr:unnamed protein product [Cylindrotheca closterium]